MKILEQYLAYIKNNPEGYWFKRKLYGWGWTPATWQGWAVTLLYIASIILFSLTITDETPSANDVAFTFILPVVLLTSTLIGIAYKKGEKPRWQWGPKDFK